MAFIPEWRDCPECGEEFYQDQPWKRTCLPCWQEAKNGTPRHPREGAAELAALRFENDRLQRQITQLKYRLTQPMAAPRPTFTADMLARLIRLCHPDRHHGSEASNAATAWLLGQRNLI